MEVLGDELSHYVDYKKGRKYNDARQNISTYNGDDAKAQTVGYVNASPVSKAEEDAFQATLSKTDFSQINSTVAKTEGLEHRVYVNNRKLNGQDPKAPDD